MSARDELLATGQLGEDGARLLYEVIGLVGRVHRFPAPDGSHLWDSGACQVGAHAFLASHRAPARLREVAVRSTDDRSFERLLEKAVRNHMRDEARGTDLGKVIVRVKAVLRSSEQFTVARIGSEDHWGLVDGRQEISQAPLSDLVQAIRRERVVVPRWTSETRDAPLADRETLVRLMQLVLVAASGVLTAREIAGVLTSRLDHRRAPLTEQLDRPDSHWEPGDPAADPALLATASVQAAHLFESLTDQDRTIVAHADLTVRDLADALGTGKSSAALARQRLMDRLADELDGDDDQEQTVDSLLTLCDHWLDHRTRSTPPMSGREANEREE